MTLVTQTHLPAPVHRGKVRDTYDLGNGYLLMVATDRISAFDVVLPTAIPQKGLILARLSAFWFQRTAHLVPNHLVALADETNSMPAELAKHPLLADLDPELQKRSMVVRRAQRIDIECVARGYLAGSAWAEYRQQGTVFGRPLPAGLEEGSPLPQLLFTPTTKAEQGHDEPMTSEQVVALVGPDTAKELERTTLQVYAYARDLAATRGIIIADTKLEFGFIQGELTLIDELLTPDSSRFWDATGYQPGQAQPNFDKQFVRDWLTESGWDREPPAPELPATVVERTAQRYLEAYRRITEKELD